MDEVDDLRDAEPFDRFFIDAMIRHHEQAVESGRDRPHRNEQLRAWRAT